MAEPECDFGDRKAVLHQVAEREFTAYMAEDFSKARSFVVPPAVQRPGTHVQARSDLFEGPAGRETRPAPPPGKAPRRAEKSDRGGCLCHRVNTVCMRETAAYILASALK